MLLHVVTYLLSPLHMFVLVLWVTVLIFADIDIYPFEKELQQYRKEA